MGDLNLDAANSMANELDPNALDAPADFHREVIKLGRVFAHVAIAFTRCVVSLTDIAKRESGGPH